MWKLISICYVRTLAGTFRYQWAYIGGYLKCKYLIPKSFSSLLVIGLRKNMPSDDVSKKTCLISPVKPRFSIILCRVLVIGLPNSVFTWSLMDFVEIRCLGGL